MNMSTSASPGPRAAPRPPLLSSLTPSSYSVASRSPSISPPPFGRRGARRGVPFGMPPPQPSPTARRPNKARPPQEAINDFWAKFTTKTPGKATRVIPPNRFVDRVVQRSARDADGSASPCSAGAAASPTSYQDAAAMCRAKVAKIVKECRRVNKKYRDPHFDLESDLKLGRRDTLQSLCNVRGAVSPPGSSFCPRSAKRVTEIFDRPQFYIGGPTANDVRQGRDGDCWLMSALCTLSNKEGLIERLCVAHDPDVGVYGFVFYRDGEWISEITDDFLYLTKPDYDESYTDRILFDECERVNPEEAYRRIYQSNSGSLYFAQCEHPQETWLPLLEKCYAKAHGDYAAIEGGFGGEGIEDLTGGVTSEIFTTDILDKERFWSELLRVNQDFLFGCSTGVWGESAWGERKGIMERHSYSVQRAVDIDGKRLVRLKNPWGKGEWKGPWSDGSKEWTPKWLEKLGHRFGDDGDFWIAYEDLLHKYQAFERTRLFGDDWSVTQIWTTFNVTWMVNYHDTCFSLSISRPGPVVLVLSQLDDRYFHGLEGQYKFELAFRLHKAGHEDYIVRSQTPYRMRRSVNVELDLDAGDYIVRVKIDACRYEDVLPIEQVVRENAKDRREKLTRIGLAYDLAHGKGRVLETLEEKAAKEAHEKRKTAKERLEMKKRIQADRKEQHYLKKKQHQRDMKKQRKARNLRKATAAASAKNGAEAGSTQTLPSEPGEEAALPESAPGGLVSSKTRTAGDEGPGHAELQVAGEPKQDRHVRVEAGDEQKESMVQQKPEGQQEPEGQQAPEGQQESRGQQESEGRQESEGQQEPKGQQESKGPQESKAAEGGINDLAAGSVEASPSQTRPAGNESDSSLALANAECESERDPILDVFDALSELSDRELDLQVDMRLESLRGGDGGRSPAPAPCARDDDDNDDDDEADEFERDPWNAVAVVGLRVYHEAAAPSAVALAVVRPNPYATGDDDGADGAPGADCKGKELDVDDSAKDATLVGAVADRKKSIMANGLAPSP